MLQSTTTSPDVLSVDFFVGYDELDQDASSLEDATSALQEAKAERDQLQRELSKLQKDLRTLRAFVKEQKDRIGLVSTHWFYGTTLLQPQLWLRGGCKGKIERARIKLEKVQDQDLPELQSIIQLIQQEQLPPLQQAVGEQLERFELSANAVSTRNAMRERAFTEHPSPKLLQLQQQNSALQQNIATFQREASSLDDVISQLFQGQTQYKGANNLLEDALKHNEKYEQLKNNPVPVPKPLKSLNNKRSRRSETMVANGSKVIVIEGNNNGPTKDLFHLGKDGKIIATNFPCPSGCGFLVNWHETHCCNACQHGRGGHGQRCEHKPLSTQQGAEHKMKVLEKQKQAHATSMTRENDNANRKFTQARKEAKQAERTVRQALSSIPISIRERYPAVCNSLLWNTTMDLPPSSPHGGCHCSKIRASNIRQEILRVTRPQTVLSEQVLGTVQQLMTQVRQDTQDLEQEQHALETILGQEQNRIFQELRTRVMGPSTPPTPLIYDEATPVPPPPAFAPHGAPTPSAPTPTPSAPTEDQLLSSMYNYES
jgi:hypothetical protein